MESYSILIQYRANYVMLSIFKAWELYRTASHHTVVLVLPSCTSSSSNSSIGIPCVIPVTAFYPLFKHSLLSIVWHPIHLRISYDVRLKRRVRAEMAGIYIRKNIDSHFGWIGGDTYRRRFSSRIRSCLAFSSFSNGSRNFQGI